MEETNYYRKPLTVGDDPNSGYTSSANADKTAEGESQSSKRSIKDTSVTQDGKGGSQLPGKAPLGTRLKIFHKETLHHPNRMRGMALRPLIFLSFPIIFYSGFSYGSSLV